MGFPSRQQMTSAFVFFLGTLYYLWPLFFYGKSLENWVEAGFSKVQFSYWMELQNTLLLYMWKCLIGGAHRTGWISIVIILIYGDSLLIQ